MACYKKTTSKTKAVSGKDTGGVVLEKGKKRILRQKTIGGKNVFYVDFYFPSGMNLPKTKQTHKFTDYWKALQFYLFLENLLKIK